LVYGRRYGVLEKLALVLLTIAAMTFNQVLYVKTRSPDRCSVWGGWESCLTAVIYVFALLYAERALKPHHTTRNPVVRYWVQRARIEVGALVVALIPWFLLMDEATNYWSYSDFLHPELILYMALSVVHNWLAGLITKRFSQTAQLVVHQLSLVCLFFPCDGWPSLCLAIVVVLSAQLYRMGRHDTTMALKAERAQAERTQAETETLLHMQNESQFHWVQPRSLGQSRSLGQPRSLDSQRLELSSSRGWSAVIIASAEIIWSLQQFKESMLSREYAGRVNSEPTPLGAWRPSWMSFVVSLCLLVSKLGSR